MNLSLAEIADLVRGRLAGDPAARATGVASLAAAQPGDVAFARKDALAQASGFRGVCLLAPEPVPCVPNQILVPEPQLAFAAVLRVVESERRPLPSGVHAGATIAPTAQLGAGVAVGPCATVGEHAVIGENTAICAGVHVGDHVRIGPGGLIYPGVVIRERVTIGRNVIIHPNTTIGGDGFGFVPSQGRQVKMPQVGAVRIGDDVEIGCNCTIDRGAIEDTIIENGVKTDNHCHVAHNCRIGENTILVAYVRIGGSTTIGKNCILAEDAAITDHVTLGDNCILTATTRVAKSWPSGSVLGGTPAMPFDEAKRVIMAQTRVPKALREITDLREKVGKILQRLGLG